MGGEMGRRDDFLDLLKGIGILLVYLGHTCWYGSLAFRVIFFVHMPLFFLVAGMVFDPTRHGLFRAVAKKVAVGLIVPYFFFAALAFVMKADLRIPLLLSHLPTQLYGLFVRGDCILALWFLVCLAVVRLAYYLVFRLGVERSPFARIGLLCAALGFAELSTAYVYPYRKAVPLMLPSVPAALFFFAVGRWISPRFGVWRQVFGRWCVGWPVLVVGCGVCVVSSALLPIYGFDLRQGVFSTVGLLPCFAGLAAVVALAALIERGGWTSPLLYLGRCSLVFFAMEQNVSHLFTVGVGFLGFKAPEAFCTVDGPVEMKLARFVVCLCTVALLTPVVSRMLRGLQKRLTVGD